MFVSSVPLKLPQPVSTRGPLSLVRFTAAQAARALDHWEQLERRIGSTAIANSNLWTNTWLRHYGDLISHEFLLAESGGQPRGICLLTRGAGESWGALRLRSLHVGTAGEPNAESVCVEYNRLLVEDGFRADFCRLLVAHVEREADWDQFQFDGFAPGEVDVLLSSFPAVDVRRRTSRYFDLQSVRESGTDILSALGSSTRSNLRRRLRGYGELTIDWVDSLIDAEEVFSELVSLHQARWTAVGKPGVFASRRFHDFQLELMVRGLDDRRVVLFRVGQGRQTIGCLFLLVDCNRLLDYLSGFAAFDQHASPGLVVHYLCMLEALRRGYDAYDFLVGEHQHKRNLSNAQGELIWATWRRDRLKFRMADVARRVKRTVRYWRSSEAPQTSDQD
ncbi:MAG: GNAT family N-acetyltransferase [Planctomycetaceae bacterium]